jgi:hypothetical protein
MKQKSDKIRAGTPNKSVVASQLAGFIATVAARCEFS